MHVVLVDPIIYVGNYLYNYNDSNYIICAEYINQCLYFYKEVVFQFSCHMESGCINQYAFQAYIYMNKLMHRHWGKGSLL